jgi:hypothetical protein
MHVSRKIITGTLALLLLASATTASAADGRTTEKQHIRDTITFSMQPGPAGCPQLQNALDASGRSDITLKTTTFPNGSRQVVDDREVNGRAVDTTTRKSYKFQYLHHAIFSQSADGSVVHVDFTDRFVIVKEGRDNLVETNFHWLWTYAPADPSALPTAVTMPWPPADNWVQLESNGDPLSCDPI